MAVVLHDAQLFGPVEVDGGVLGEGVEAQVLRQLRHLVVVEFLAEEGGHFLDLAAQVLTGSRRQTRFYFFSCFFLFSSEEARQRREKAKGSLDSFFSFLQHLNSSFAQSNLDFH